MDRYEVFRSCLIFVLFRESLGLFIRIQVDSLSQDDPDLLRIVVTGG